MNKKAMIVEDEIIVAMDLEARLMNLGYDVIGIARSFPEAMEIFKPNELCIIFLDVNIEGAKSGVDVGKRFRELDPDVKFVFITAYSNKELLDDIASLKGYHFKKPFKEEQIMSVMNELQASS